MIWCFVVVVVLVIVVVIALLGVFTIEIFVFFRLT